MAQVGAERYPVMVVLYLKISPPLDDAITGINNTATTVSTTTKSLVDKYNDVRSVVFNFSRTDRIALYRLRKPIFAIIILGLER